MHPKLTENLIASVKRRVAQGDCPTEPALALETLEDLVLTQAARITALIEALQTGRDYVVLSIKNDGGPQGREIDRSSLEAIDAALGNAAE
jgi:hypothetical protein